MGISNTLVFFIISVSLLLLGSTAAQPSFRPRALALPVTKDASTNQYLTPLRQRTPFVTIILAVDLGLGRTWVNTESNFVSSSYRPANCARCRISPYNFVCENNTCGAFTSNPFIRVSTSGQLGEDVISLASIEGSHAGPQVIVPNFLFVGGSSAVQTGLAAGVTGIIGLGRSPMGVPIQLATTFSFPRRFAVCLPSSTSQQQPGLIVFGNTPFNLIPGLTLSNLLTYTPLYINPVSTAPVHFLGEQSVEYFIGVRSISVGTHPIRINNTLLTIDREGHGGTKISTVDPFSVLHPSIYRALTSAFIREAQSRNIRRVVPGIAPFNVCFRIAKGSRLIPHINLELNGANRPIWTITGTNSLVQVNENVSCLGFVEAGEYAYTSIVIGGLQIEDTLLEFDIARSRLGFSYSLIGHGTTCSNHNFTTAY